MDKEEASKIKSIVDFEAKEVARLKAVAEAKEKAEKEAGIEKQPLKTKAGKFKCANKGCSSKSAFTEEENEAEEPCSYHSGDAVFHDLKKYWSCCNPNGQGKLVGYDWDEFMLLPTCQKGKHTYKYA